MIEQLEKREVNGGSISGDEEKGYRLEIPTVAPGNYCLAQLDDYMHLSRRSFPHQAPIQMQLQAKVSGENVAGTWGFGLWNDPFSLGFGAGGMSRLLPVLPKAAWYFYASPENHLALKEGLPASGLHAKTFHSPLLPSLLSLLAVPGIPLILWPAAARLIRKFAGMIVREAAQPLNIDVREWHTYSLAWEASQVTFMVDEERVFVTPLSPQGNLGLVLWIDNQYFRFDPQGKLSFGFLPVDSVQTLWIRGLSVAGNASEG